MAAPATRCPVHAEFDPLGEEFLRDPFALMDDLPPVFYAPSLDYYGRLRKPAARAFTPRRVNEMKLTRRFPALHLAPPDQAVPFHPNISFRGPQALWVQA
jgi:hypothetical protein